MTPSDLPPPPTRREWFAVHGGERYRVVSVNGYVTEADQRIIPTVRGLSDWDARDMVRLSGAAVET